MTPVSRPRSAPATPAATVIGGYRTAGSATVELTERPGKAGVRAECTGCPFISGPWDDDTAEDRAQAHAETCRAMPRPDGA
jgi:hypothetical protein